LHDPVGLRGFVEDNAIAFNADQTAADALVCADGPIRPIAPLNASFQLTVPEFSLSVSIQ
jgi:hypothetical protein